MAVHLFLKVDYIGAEPVRNCGPQASVNTGYSWTLIDGHFSQWVVSVLRRIINDFLEIFTFF